MTIAKEEADYHMHIHTELRALKVEESQFGRFKCTVFTTNCQQKRGDRPTNAVSILTNNLLLIRISFKNKMKASLQKFFFFFFFSFF